ncbi:hypothetical protein [Sphingomonas aerophila]|uniref:hypothetical protein n=1 Tax=Sphingomonas aerophila TaxID=1344948 RepID=UPI003CCCF4BF
MSGLGGNDVLFGKGGSDILTGGGGSDQFVFDTVPGAGNVDTLTDFESGTDRIVLENAVFQALGANGALSATMFEIGAVATRPDTHVLFDPTTGVISYDADGSGAVAAVAFALLPFGVTVNASDFLII